MQEEETGNHLLGCSETPDVQWLVKGAVLSGCERFKYVSRAAKKLTGRLEPRALDGRD